MEDGDESKAVRLAVIKNDLGYVKEKLNAVDEKVSKFYLTKEEFIPIKNIIYGLVALILVAVVGALLALVMSADPATINSSETKTTQK